ncbi:MAG: DNA translocase FtsK, partial [Ignavibacterium sp.]
MALKKKKNVKGKSTKDSSDKSYFTFTSKNKRQILGLFLVVFAIVLFFSIITFDRFDEANLTDLPADFIKSFDERIDIQNWLGVTGAHIAKFFVKATFGYFSITIPVVLFLWGISFFKTIDFKFRLHLSNLLLISTLIIASFFGVLRSNYDLFGSTYELSGFIGDYIGKFLSGLIGGIGSILLLGFGFVSLLIFA